MGPVERRLSRLTTENADGSETPATDFYGCREILFRAGGSELERLMTDLRYRNMCLGELWALIDKLFLQLSVQSRIAISLNFKQDEIAIIILYRRKLYLYNMEYAYRCLYLS